MNLVIPREYADDQTLFASNLDAAFNAVETAINDTKLDGDNIVSGGIEAANLASNSVTTVKVVDANITLAKLAQAVVDKLIPTGSVTAYVGTAAPSGWALCDGSIISRTTFSALFNVCGTAFGSGDGSTTFHLPDLRGRFLRGRDAGTARDPDASSRTAMNSGGNTADTIGSVQGSEYGAHTHTPREPGPYLFITNYVGNVAGGLNIASTGSYGGTFSTQASGGNETRPINVNVNYIVKL